MARPGVTATDAGRALGLGRPRRSELVAFAALAEERPGRPLRLPTAPSGVYFRLRPFTLGAVAAAWVLAESPSRRRIERYWRGWRHVRADLNGEDLLAAGVPEGPQVAQALARALQLKLDHPEASREQQLAAARGEGPAR